MLPIRLFITKHRMTTQIDTIQPAEDKGNSFAALWDVGRSLKTGMAHVADILVPPQCGFCGKDLSSRKSPDPQDETTRLSNIGPSQREILLCSGCRESFVSSDWAWCERCGSSKPPKESAQSGCYLCRKNPPRFDAVIPLGRYRNEQQDIDLRDAVLRMKKPQSDHLSTAMSRLYTAHRGHNILGLKPDVVVPVPMHWSRQIYRGTNSAEMLAVEIARNLHLPVARRMLIRCRKTAPQMDLQPEQRAQNVRGAFRLASGYDISDARVLLVDDILTTGATCNEVAGVLKLAGVRSVIVAAIARAEGLSRK